MKAARPVMAGRGARKCAGAVRGLRLAPHAVSAHRDRAILCVTEPDR